MTGVVGNALRYSIPSCFKISAMTSMVFIALLPSKRSSPQAAGLSEDLLYCVGGVVSPNTS